jgi:hypothetical protein
MWRKAILSLFAGIFCYFIGSVFAVPAKNFFEKSDSVTLIVLQVDEKYDHDNGRTYRPVFGLVTDEHPRPEYAGSIWVSPKPHQNGDIVEGGYDPVTGEMRSNQMAKRTLWVGRVVQALGIFLLLQGLLMFAGFPEILTVRVGSRRY